MAKTLPIYFQLPRTRVKNTRWAGELGKVADVCKNQHKADPGVLETRLDNLIRAFCCYCCLFVETRSHYLTLADLELEV